VRAQPAELDGEAAAVIGTAAFGDHGQVFWRQAPKTVENRVCGTLFPHPVKALKGKSLVVLVSR